MKDVAIVAKLDTKEKGPDGKPIFKEFKGTAKLYESVKEALAAKGEEAVLSMINRVVKSDAMASLRTGGVVGVKAIARSIAGLDAKARKEIDAIIAKYGKPTSA